MTVNVICDCVGVSVHLSSRQKKYKAGGKKFAVTSIRHVSFHTHAETIALLNMSCTGLLSPMSLQMPNGLLMLAWVVWLSTVRIIQHITVDNSTGAVKSDTMFSSPIWLYCIQRGHRHRHGNLIADCAKIKTLEKWMERILKPPSPLHPFKI